MISSRTGRDQTSETGRDRAVHKAIKTRKKRLSRSTTGAVPGRSKGPRRRTTAYRSKKRIERSRLGDTPRRVADAIARDTLTVSYFCICPRPNCKADNHEQLS